MSEGSIVISNFTDLEKEKLIKKEISRLKKTCRDMAPDKQSAAHSLIEEAAFMSVTLKDLRMTINKSGCVSVYQNGENQWGTKKSPEVDVYNTMIKNHLQVMKQIADMLPETAPDDGKEILEFMSGGK